MKDQRLIRQLDIERVIAKIANQFIMLTDLSEAINSALKLIGETSHSSRAYVFEFDDVDHTMSNTYEWCSDGVESEMDNLQGLPIDLFPWWIQKISTGEVLYIKNVADLGSEAQSEKEILESQGILSVMVLPIYFKGLLHGFIGFDDCDGSSAWEDEDLSLLRIAADIFSNAFNRLSSDFELKESNRKLTEALEQIKSYQTQLVQQEQMAAIGQLAAGVAHEINNPLGFVVSNHDVLKEYMSDMFEFAKKANLNQEELKRTSYIEEDFIDLMEDIHNGLYRIKKIVSGLRSFSRVDSNQDMDAFDLSEGLGHTLTILQSKIQYKADLEINTDEDLPYVHGDASKINQVMLNLIMNAVDAIDAKDGLDRGKIRIDIYKEGEMACFSITDNGVGIPEEIRSKIYQPFFTTKPIGKGTGYGLSVVYDAIISAHGGQIELDTKVGVGTTFIFKIPIKYKKKTV